MYKLLKPKIPFTNFFREFPILGSRDAFALTAISASVLSSNPLFGLASSAPYIVFGTSFLTSLLGSYTTFRPRIKEAYDPVDLDSREDFVIRSDDVYEGDGLLVGYTVDDNRPVRIPFELLMRHLDLIGASGVGKTTLGMFILYQQMNLNGGFLMIDAKIDVDTKDTLGYLSKTVGRERDLYILNVDDPENSNTYNPILDGDADEVASRLLNLIPSTENNPGSDHYRQLANHALTAIIGGLKAANILYHFDDLITVFQSSSAMQNLVERVPEGSKERKNLDIFLDKYRILQGGRAVIDVGKIKTEIGGLAGRMAQFSQGKFGAIFNTYTPEINLYDIIKNNKMLYIMLPTMGKGTAATNLAKMILADLMSAVDRIQRLPKSQRPWPPFPAFADEFGRYAIQESAIFFEQNRSAQVFMMPGFQGYGNLEDVSDGFADMVLQSSWNKALFRFGSDTSAERSADIIGKIKRFQETMTSGISENDGAQLLQFNPQVNEGDGLSDGLSWREVEEHRISQDKLSSIKIGQCILLIGSRIYHINVPRITTPIDDEKKGDKRKPEHVFRAYKHKVNMPWGVSGLDIASDYKRFLLENSPEAEAQRKKIELQRLKSEQKR